MSFHLASVKQFVSISGSALYHSIKQMAPFREKRFFAKVLDPIPKTTISITLILPESRIGRKAGTLHSQSLSLKLNSHRHSTDGKDKKVKFKLQDIQRQLPEETKQYSKTDLEANFERIYEEVRSIFEN